MFERIWERLARSEMDGPLHLFWNMYLVVLANHPSPKFLAPNTGPLAQTQTSTQKCISTAFTMSESMTFEKMFDAFMNSYEELKMGTWVTIFPNSVRDNRWDLQSSSSATSSSSKSQGENEKQPICFLKWGRTYGKKKEKNSILISTIQGGNPQNWRPFRCRWAVGIGSNSGKDFLLERYS